MKHEFLPLEMVEPDLIRDCWPKLRDRADAIATAGGYAWIAEDVFIALMGGNAILYTTEDLTGFVVVQIHPQPTGNSLFVWLAHNQQSEAGALAYWEELGAIAAAHDCVSREFISHRGGFQRAIPGIEVRYVYSQRVE